MGGGRGPHPASDSFKWLLRLCVCVRVCVPLLLLTDSRCSFVFLVDLND